MSDEKKTTQLTGAFYLGGRRLDTSHAETMEYVRSRFAAKPAQPVEAVDERTAVGEVDRTAPERIYLQVDGDGDSLDRDESFPNFPDYEVTWWAESQGGLEVEYVRADLAHPRPSTDKESLTVADPRATVPDGYTLICDRELAHLRDRQSVFLDADRGGHLWYWQGDGYDVPESLACSVVMSADTLRALIAKTAPTVEQAGEVVGESKFFETIWKDATDLGVIDRKAAEFVWHSAMGYARAYAQPRAVGVPDAITNLNECRERGWEDGALAYRSGWNDCRRAALGEKPLGFAGCHELATSVGVKS